MARRGVGRLPVSFYARPTLDVLTDVIGKVLVHDHPDGPTAGVIVEAEAYIGEEDPACHAAPGLTKRNAPLYGPPGRAYVYLNYGIHELVNAVTEDEGRPAAVLIRALAPLEGSDLMRGPMTIEDRGLVAPAVDYSPRVGIRVGADRLWRCVWRGHPAVSGPRRGS